MGAAVCEKALRAAFPLLQNACNSNGKMEPHYSCMHAVSLAIREANLEELYLNADAFCAIPHFCKNFGETKYGVRCPTVAEIRANDDS